MTVFASAIAAFISSSDEKSNTFSPIYSGSVSSGQMTVASVSYTHLDVYKRQALLPAASPSENLM